MPLKDATLCYIFDDGEVLLIYKKRGLGAGKYNAPGGKVNENEKPKEAARREVREETRVRPINIGKIGELCIHDGTENPMIVHVFTAFGFEGQIEETDEAVPEWFPVNQLPYERMWEHDSSWLPYVLEGTGFQANIYRDGSNAVRSCTVEQGDFASMR